MKTNKNILIACTGSVATIKLTLLIEKLLAIDKDYSFNIKVIVTERAKHFIENSSIPEGIEILDDQNEWSAWNKRGDPVVHIDLGKWADMLVIAPLSANSLAKIAMGLCDNLLLCVVRAWDVSKPLLFCPAMNTRMFDHPITQEHITKLKTWGYHEVATVAKTLMCGDTGNGAMAEVETIIENILCKFENVKNV
ncbi:phosphopantothenoylcysteine decarboxylase-like [Lucilia sericata]|uniref:phosphopantothenoylcysteine decarboxylase-like n=1 Tax=Lucilia sericata TaxID=13632 RepID=UPI0018A86852|nr:phosphopantothenoylcysteine decarboxylase-like [Lucilia sericata]XP_037825474.1 phosphopantothenoylcysteine decarboxylase-like [Lucilia sericata]